jgi:hypothetical protein
MQTRKNKCPRTACVLLSQMLSRRGGRRVASPPLLRDSDGKVRYSTLKRFRTIASWEQQISTWAKGTRPAYQLHSRDQDDVFPILRAIALTYGFLSQVILASATAARHAPPASVDSASLQLVRQTTVLHVVMTCTSMPTVLSQLMLLYWA